VTTRTRLAELRTRLAELNRRRRRRGLVSPISLATAQARLLVGLLGTLAGLGFLLWSGIQYIQPSTPGTQIRLDALTQLAKNGQVLTATFYDFDKRVGGTAVVQVIEGKTTRLQHLTYWAAYPQSDSETPFLIDKLSAANAQVRVQTQGNKAVVQFLIEFLAPLVILANLFALIFLATRAGGEGIGGIIQFGGIGKRRSKLDASSRITFADVAGADDTVAELREVRDYLSDPRRFAALGATPPKGVLMTGPPGCGKTLMARAVAGEADVPFFSVSGAEFVESLVGIGAARVRDLFRQVRQVAPAILFIDEIDAAGRKRGGVTGGQEEREQTLNQLLIEMDGFHPTSGIVVIGATNRPDILDPALLRPGRFDRQVTVEPPDHAGREAILGLYARRRPLEADVDITQIARRTPGFTGADLASVVNEASLLCVRSGRPAIGMAEMTEAVQRVLSGPRRRGHLLSDVERVRTAYHETGHVIVATAMGRFADVDRISIVARGRSAGQTAMRKSWTERFVLTHSELRAELVTIMGGAAAEVLVFGELSTGADSDVQQATGLARLMVGRYGMSERLGRVQLVRIEGSEFLGAETMPDDMTTATVLTEMHEEVRSLIAAAEAQATEVLLQHRALLDQVAAQLQVRESLEGPELETLLAPARADRSLLGVPLGPAEPADGNGSSGRTGLLVTE
jgi:cell division protease FtsH